MRNFEAHLFCIIKDNNFGIIAVRMEKCLLLNFNSSNFLTISFG